MSAGYFWIPHSAGYFPEIPHRWKLKDERRTAALVGSSLGTISCLRMVGNHVFFFPGKPIIYTILETRFYFLGAARILKTPSGSESEICESKMWFHLLLFTTVDIVHGGWDEVVKLVRFLATQMDSIMDESTEILALKRYCMSFTLW